MDHEEALGHAEHQDTKPEVLHAAVTQHPKSEAIHSAALAHPNTGTKTLQHIYDNAHTTFGDYAEDRKAEIASHPNAPKHIVQHHFEQITPQNYENHKELLFHTDVSPKARAEKIKEILNHHEEGYEPGELSYQQRSLAADYLHHQDTPDEEVIAHTKHKNPQLAAHAAASLTERRDHVAPTLARKDIKPEHIADVLDTDDVTPNPEFMHAAYKKGGSDIVRALAQHKDTPKEIIDQIVDSKKGKSNDGSYWGKTARQHALEHPHTEPAKIQKLVDKGDAEAMRAAVQRDDSSPEMLRTIFSHKDKLGAASTSSDLLAHKNFPKDLTHAALKESTDAARTILRRREIDPETMKMLLSHKNQGVATDALSHPSMTPELVMHAYNRKAGDVSRAAANHPLAPAELKVAKAQQDPEAALQLAQSSNDPEVLSQIFKAHKDNPDVLTKLSNNKHLDNKTVNALLVRERRGDLDNTDRWSHDKKWKAKVHNHPNIDAEGRAHYLKHNPVAIMDHPNMTSEEITQGLKAGAAMEGRYSDENKARINYDAIRHQNLSPEDAKDLVTGKYGNFQGENFKFIHERPEVFTKEHIKAGLDTPHELAHNDLVNEMAQSPHLDENDIRSYYKKHNEILQNDDTDKGAHAATVVDGLMRNKNVPADLRNMVLNRSNPTTKSNHQAMTLLQNPSLTSDEIKEATVKKNPVFDSEAVSQEAASRIRQDKGLREHVLKNTLNPQLAAELVHDNNKGWGARYSDENAVKTALENKDPDVLKAVANTLTKAHTQTERGKRGKPDRTYVSVGADKQKHIDKLADHPNYDVAESAFAMMSPKAQHKVLERSGGDYSANLIPHLDSRAVENLPITNQTTDDQAAAILRHPGASKEHFAQAVAHDNEAVARTAVRHMAKDVHENKNSKFTQEDLDEVLGKASQKHNVNNLIAKHSRDPKLLKRLLANPAENERHLDEVVSNPAVKTADLQGLTKFHQPEHSHAFGQIAGMNKVPVEVLQHIAEHYPENLSTVASNPKAANSKIIKSIVGSNDVDAKANLVNNEAIPQGVKDELLKDKSVLFTAKPDSVSNEQLAEYAGDKDLNTVHAVVNHQRANAEIGAKATSQALKGMKENPELANKIIQSVAERGIVNKDAAQKVMAHSPQAAAALVRSNRKAVAGADPIQYLDLHKGKEGFQDLLHSYANAGAFNHPTIASEIVKNADLNAVPGRTSMTKALAQMFNQEQNSQHLKPEHYDTALSRMSEARPADFKYSADEKGQKLKQGDAELMNSLLGNAENESVSAYVNNPHFANALAGNTNIKGQNLDKLVEHLSKEESPNGSALENIAGNMNLKPEHLGAVLGQASKLKDADTRQDVFNAIGSHPNLSEKEVDQILQDSPASVVGTRKVDGNKLKSYMGTNPKMDDNTLHAIGRNPSFRLEHLPESLNGDHKNSIKLSYSGSYHADPKDLSQIWNQRDQLTNKKELINNLRENVNTPAHIVHHMLNEGMISRDDAMESPVIGGELWRKEKKEFPEDTGVKPGLEVNEAHFRPREEKIRQIQTMIPENGFLDWAEFKKANPNLAGDPVVQRMFTTAPKARVDADHAENYLKNMPSKKFLMDYSHWAGAQRHNGKTQTVFKLNNSEQIDDQMKQNPQLVAIYKILQSASQSSGHPNGPQHIGWSRVDTSHPEHWFIDEIQSDFDSSVARHLNEANEKGHTQALQDYGIEPQDAPRVLNQLGELYNGWQKALLSNIIETAKKHGVKQISIHSGQSKTAVNKAEASEVTNKYDKIYNRMPESMGFKPNRYNRIPTASKSNDKLKDMPIWTLDLTGAEPEQEKATPEAKPEAKSAQRKVK